MEVVIAQSAKRTGRVCGDYVIVDRTQEATTTIVADGIGTGIKARVAAVMCASRLIELIRLGFSLREACNKLVDTMHEARTIRHPFCGVLCLPGTEQWQCNNYFLRDSASNINQ